MMTKEEGQDRKKHHEQLLDTWHNRADEFSKLFADKDKTYEMGYAQNFIRELCNIYDAFSVEGVLFEDRITKLGGGGINRIDGFLPGLMLIEMKSGGIDPITAREQAFRYIEILKDKRPEDVPRYVLISDFRTLHLYDRTVSETDPIAIEVAYLRDHVETFAFLSGYERIVEQRQEKVNARAAEKLANLHDAVKATGYDGKHLETLLVRILFCLFGEDTGLFGEPDKFKELINNSLATGKDLYGTLDLLFISLDTPQRPTAMYQELQAFPYVNGELFKGRLDPCYFDANARTALLECSKDIDWSQISPAIFGSLFQFIMHDEGDTATKSKKRREFGAHYTSEKNILKTIGPLFLDSLKKELKACKGEYGKLEAFRTKLLKLRIFDPACGCGNFLVVAYREIRLLEEQTLNELKKGQMSLDMPLCNVNQFYGIEIDPSAAQIATLALWLTDHQMNMRIRQPDGKPYIRLPLTAKANIFCGNALQLDWNSVIKAEECSYIVGNPPFVGAKFLGDPQRADMLAVCDGIKSFGLLDYVTAWYVKAVTFIKANPAVSAAFVSTNSITQGEQVGVLWNWILQQGVHIHFAHRTFRWNNEGKGVAAVHCVVIGFGLDKPKKRVIFEYPDINGDPQTLKAKNINPYLVDATNIIIEKRSMPLCDAPIMKFGNQPIDGGYLLFDAEEKKNFLLMEPYASKWVKRYYGSTEFINNIERWCLWLKGVSSDDLQKMPLVIQRLNSVREFRLSSDRAATRELADSPASFAFISHTDEPYIIVPSVSSERRPFIPIGFMPSNVIASNLCLIIPNATLYHFGILCSTMHNSWMRAVCGRMKSDYRYSAGIVYNNFSWPQKLAEEHKQAVKDKAQKVLDVRKSNAGQTLAWMYNPETMPDDLKKAHAELDAAVDAAYSYTGKPDDAARVAFLFGLYGELIDRVVKPS